VSFLRSGTTPARNLAAPLQHAKHNGLAFIVSVDGAASTFSVHIAGFAPDEGFIDLNFTTSTATGRIVLHRHPNPMN
jgi:hypothetical protein